ncbi:MAG: HNH endonuclease [Betaproteobacteria bacterium]|nr:HNH endonuclease [Betaproteobacteria bacterium]
MDDIELIPLEISVRPDTWLMDDDQFAIADPNWSRIRREVLVRDDHTCQHCGLRSTKWQEIAHIDDDHLNNDPANLRTICSFCHLSYHLGAAARRNLATLCWIPEMSQIQINHMIRSMLALEMWLSRMPPNAPVPENIAYRAMLDTLKGALAVRSGLVAHAFGSSSPMHLGSALLDLATRYPEAYEDRQSLIDGIRLVPTGGKRETPEGRDTTAEMIAHLIDVSGPYGGAMPVSWMPLLQQYATRLNGGF